MKARFSKEARFEVGDRVRFIGPYLYNGREHGEQDLFNYDIDYEVVDHGEYQDQYDMQETPHVVLTTPKGNHQWVDEDCLDFVAPDEDEVQAAVESILRAGSDAAR